MSREKELQEELNKVYAVLERIAALDKNFSKNVPVSRDELLKQSADLSLAVNLSKLTLRNRSK